MRFGKYMHAANDIYSEDYNYITWSSLIWLLHAKACKGTYRATHANITQKLLRIVHVHV